jgi:hypothetical protein
MKRHLAGLAAALGLGGCVAVPVQGPPVAYAPAPVVVAPAPAVVVPPVAYYRPYPYYYYSPFAFNFGFTYHGGYRHGWRRR